LLLVDVDVDDVVDALLIIDDMRDVYSYGLLPNLGASLHGRVT
jgi:hypothetical protein